VTFVACASAGRDALTPTRNAIWLIELGKDELMMIHFRNPAYILAKIFHEDPPRVFIPCTVPPRKILYSFNLDVLPLGEHESTNAAAVHHRVCQTVLCLVRPSILVLVILIGKSGDIPCHVYV
jgi:hypothetical protein